MSSNDSRHESLSLRSAAIKSPTRVQLWVTDKKKVMSFKVLQTATDKYTITSKMELGEEFWDKGYM